MHYNVKRPIYAMPGSKKIGKALDWKEAEAIAASYFHTSVRVAAQWWLFGRRRKLVYVARKEPA